VELRQLQYFAAVARHGHVTRAAEDLYVTQSALSQQIRRLEDEPLRVIAAPGDVLVSGGHLTPSGLRGAALVLPEPGSALRQTVLDACSAAGFSPVPRFEVSDPPTVRFLVHAGLAVAVVPASWLEVPGPEVAVAELDAAGVVHRPALMAAKAGPPPAGRLLLERLRLALG
jgi:DNA-binding transcriptional LysR family regulator